MDTQTDPLKLVERQLTGVREGQEEHSASLRAISDKLDRLIEILTPKETDGPTLDEILAMLVAQIAQQNVLLRRIDERTGEIHEHLGIDTPHVAHMDGDQLRVAPGAVAGGANGSGSQA